MPIMQGENSPAPGALIYVRLLFAAVLIAIPACAQENCRPHMPCYSAASIVNGASFQPGAAPGTYISIFGTGLAWEPRGRTGDDSIPGLGGIHVLVNGLSPALVVYASPEQVNVLLPGSMRPGKATIQLTRDGISGPLVDLTLADYAPALFLLDAETVVALKHPGWQVATLDNPAEGGDIVALFATGLGPLEERSGDFDIPQKPIPIEVRRETRILLNGVPVPDSSVLYAGCAPTYYGLYQINLHLPKDVDPDPEIQISVAGRLSPPGVRIRVRPKEH